MTTKLCRMCGKKLPISNFYTKKSGRWVGQLFSYCIPCNAEKSRKWYQNNKQRHIKRAKDRQKEYRKECLKLLGDKCVSCSIKDERVLCIDHIDGDGSIDRRGAGLGMYYRILQKIKTRNHRYQILCRNCNWIKALENNELSRIS